ncbi:helix-turn-helix transcriptional regulator [Sphingobium yanoikuyae]|uniref:AlpA family transcriptional regulator n=1 Tax=Sphingobium yanoikuyae TaxID=13690 RepID=A0A291N2T0_SPHYA|nr:AlpA family phage regulatory protein [Sphingobium yanoikuyae]ATI81438.1 AlpA family transcriptional regulator [Sphingobium yanoikuyae]
MTAHQPERLLKIDEVMRRTSLSRTHLYALIKRGDFPAQRKMGYKCSRWVESEIDAWVTKLAA